MTTEVLAQSLLAGVQATFPQGRIFYIKTASANLTLTAETIGSGAKVRKFINVSAGFKFTADPGDGWTYLRCLSLVNQAVEMVIGDDDVELANAVSVTGTVTTAILPSGTLTDAANVALPNAATTAIVAANPARRRVTIGNPSTALASFFIRAGAAGANNLLEVQPGIFVELDTTAAVAGRNDSGAALSATVLEEV